MTSKIELTDEAERLLMSAKLEIWGPNETATWLIYRRLGYKTWQSGGKTGARRDVAELYRHDLIAEWFNPWAPPVFLTQSGKEQRNLRDTIKAAV